MHLRLLLEVFVLLGCVWRTASAAGDGKEIFQNFEAELSQEEAELILSAQTSYRRYFIQFLTIIQKNTEGYNSLHSVVGKIFQGLLSRALDPLKSFQNGFSINCNQTTAYRAATIIYSLQDCDSRETGFSEWYSFFRMIPNIDAIIPSPPDINLNPQHIYKANSHKTSFVILVLLAVHHGHLTLTETLFHNILYNYCFRNYSPDLDIIVQSLNVSHALLETDPTATGPNEILFGILESLSRQQDSILAFKTNLLLSALSRDDNVVQMKMFTSWELFSLITHDEYPPDIVEAATEISSVVKDHQIKIDTRMLTGYSPLEQLLSVVTQLSVIPTAHPLSGKVRAVYPHVKLKFLSLRQKFFRPRTSSDVLFLLHSFLTTSSASLIEEMYKIFRHSHFNWQNILKKFDYSKYSRPRTLLLDMTQELAKTSTEFPLLRTFLQSSSQLPKCLPLTISDKTLSSSITTVSSDMQSTGCQKVHIACKEQLTGEECQENETAVAVVNTDTLVPYAHRMAERIKSFIIPIDSSKKFTKRDVLLNIFSRLEFEEDATEIKKVKDNMLSSTDSLEEVDVVYLCMKNSIVENTQQQTPLPVLTNTHKPSVIFFNSPLRHSNVLRQTGLVMSQLPHTSTTTPPSPPSAPSSATTSHTSPPTSPFIFTTPSSSPFTSSPSHPFTQTSLTSAPPPPSHDTFLFSSAFTTSSTDHSTEVPFLPSTILSAESYSLTSTNISEKPLAASPTP